MLRVDMCMLSKYGNSMTAEDCVTFKQSTFQGNFETFSITPTLRISLPFGKHLTAKYDILFAVK